MCALGILYFMARSISFSLSRSASVGALLVRCWRTRPPPESNTKWPPGGGGSTKRDGLGTSDGARLKPAVTEPFHFV